jgi:hypothetical protein
MECLTLLPRSLSRSSPSMFGIRPIDLVQGSDDAGGSDLRNKSPSLRSTVLERIVNISRRNIKQVRGTNSAAVNWIKHFTCCYGV